jgi:hypothetical protein
MYPTRAVLAAAAVLLLAPAPVLSVAEPAADTSPRLEVSPSPLKLGQGETRQIVVVARNPGTATVRVVALAALADPGLTATVDGTPRDVPAGAGVAWTVRVVRAANSVTAGLVVLRLDYQELSTDKQESPAIRTITSSLEVQDRPAPSLETILGVRVESTLTFLQAPRPGYVFLIVKNKETFPITLVKIIEQRPPFVTLTPATYENIVLAPRQERGLPVTVIPKDAVPNGKFLLVFEVQATWNEAGVTRSGSIIAKHDFDVGLLGTAELQTLLTAAGVPTFLLAPGFLIVVVFVMLWNLSSTSHIPLDLTKPEFWSIAVLLSMLAAVAYPHLTLPSRNYLDGYGLRDVFNVWVGSFLVAAIA